MKNLLETRLFPRLVDTIALHGKFQKKKIALKYPATGKTVSYEEFVNHMDMVASNLITSYQNKKIATLLGNNSDKTLTTMFGVTRAGSVLVPLNASLKPNQIETMLADSDSKIIIASKEYSHLIPDSVKGIRRIGFDFSNDKWEPFFERFDTRGEEIASKIPNGTGQEEFNIIYTSGTTGTPKGIVQTHANRLHWAWSNSIAMRFQPNSKALTTTALYSNGTFLIIIPTLFVGATLHILPHFDAEMTLATIASEKISHTFMVPTQLKMCLEANSTKYNLSSIQALLSAGSTLNPDIKKRVLREMTSNLFELYGCSEGYASMLYPEEQITKSNTVGRPLFGNDLKIVEAEGHKEVESLNTIGEICVRGPGMMSSYNNRPDETLNELWVDPKTNQKYFRTGDMGTVDEDGYLTLMERKKDMIISGGFNIFPKDIEEIALQNENVADVAVVAVPHEKWGETPLAIIIPKANSSITEIHLKEWINSRVSKVQRVSFVKILQATDNFPRNVLGKVMKKDLRAKLKEWKIPNM